MQIRPALSRPPSVDRGRRGCLRRGETVQERNRKRAEAGKKEIFREGKHEKKGRGGQVHLPPASSPVEDSSV